MNKLCKGLLMILALSIGGTAIASGKNTAIYVTTAKIVDIEEVYKTSKVKRYSNCKDVQIDSVTKTFCDNIEWITINTDVESYRVTYKLYGSEFTILEKSRPVGIEKRMKVIVTPYR